MKVRRICSALLILLCGVMLWGCSNKNHVKIESLKEYYMDFLVPYSFQHKIEKTHSFLEFGKDFKSMRISFDSLGGRHDVTFVVTSCERKKGQIKGTSSRIESDGPDKGKLIRYSFWSDSTKIYLKTLVANRVYTATDSHEIVTIARNEVVAKFVRTEPGYIGGGA